MTITIGQEIIANVNGWLVWGAVVGFGVENNKQVVDLNNGRWVYLSQIIG